MMSVQTGGEIDLGTHPDLVLLVGGFKHGF